MKVIICSQTCAIVWQQQQKGHKEQRRYIETQKVINYDR